MNDRTTTAHEHLLETSRQVEGSLHEVIEKHGALSFTPIWSGLSLPDVITRAVAGQQLSTKASRAIWMSLLEGANGTPVHVYALEVGEEQLRNHGLSSAKARAVFEVAEMYDAGLLDVDELRAMPAPQRDERLMELWGVGQWTTNMVAMYYFGDEDVWPTGDSAARSAILSLTTGADDCAVVAAPFAPYRSYLAMHMWRWKNESASRS